MQSEREGLAASAQQTKKTLETLDGTVEVQKEDIKDAVQDAAVMRIQFNLIHSRCDKAKERLRYLEEVKMKEQKQETDQAGSHLAQRTAELFELRKDLAELRLKAMDMEKKLTNEEESKQTMELTLSETRTEHAELQRAHQVQLEILKKAQTDLEFAKVGEQKAITADEKAKRAANQSLAEQQKADRETLDAKSHELSVQAELGEVRTNKEAALSRYDVVAAELRSVEKSCSDWRYLGEQAQSDLDNLRTEREKNVVALGELQPKCDQLTLQLAEVRTELELTQKAKKKLEEKVLPMEEELASTNAELKEDRLKTEALQKEAEAGFQVASTATREFRSAAQETSVWRKLAVGASKDLEGFMARKQFEVRDRLAISDENRRRFEATRGFQSLNSTSASQQPQLMEGGHGGGSQPPTALMNLGGMGGGNLSRPQTQGSVRSNGRAQAKQLEETLQLITIQTTELTYIQQQGMAYLKSPLLFGS